MGAALSPYQIQANAIARNGALWGHGWGGKHGVGMPRGEVERGEYLPLMRKRALGENPIYFTPHDRVMVFCQLVNPMLVLAETETRPWRLLVMDKPATDKRGRVRKWGSSQAALAEARRIERDALGIPRRARVGTKAKAAPAGPLLSLMEPLGEPSIFCRWFALCDRPADRVRSHPIMGDVPICKSCDEKYEELS